jgi:serine/threonine-protein kinase 24/25/MST4
MKSSAQDPRSRYEVCERIGTGSFGAVYRVVERRTGRTYAAKIIDLEEAEDGMEVINQVHHCPCKLLSCVNAVQEISVLSSSRCPQLTEYYGSYVVERC